MVFRYDEIVTSRPPPSDSDVDLGPPEEHEGRETLLPPATRSVLSMRSSSYSMSDLGVERLVQQTPTPDPDAERRGAKSGDVIGGRYVCEGQLGRGGMGRVMRVRHQALGKVFALKLIKSTIATNPKIREMFYREARLASALTHENICSIVDFGQDETFGLFMVMELLDGQTVHAKLKQSGKLSPKVACDIMFQVADATRFIHSRAILHGDIKTENIFLCRTTMQRRLVKLLDFGLARPDYLGRKDGLDGTPEYMAPERIDGAPASQLSDIYALGIVFFELLTGHLPFHGDLQDVFKKHRETMPPPPSLLVEGLDERADTLVMRATAKDPARRHPDVQAFMYELRALMGMLGMESSASRRRMLAPDAARERRDIDNRMKAAAEVFSSVPLPMASCDSTGKVRAANKAFLEFLGCAGDAGGLQLRDSALPEVYPGLFEDLNEVMTKRRPIKRVIYLNEGGDRVVEAAIVLAPAPSGAEVTAGEVHLVLHPLRALLA
jgi:PAS domain-containing protein